MTHYADRKVPTIEYGTSVRIYSLGSHLQKHPKQSRERQKHHERSETETAEGKQQSDGTTEQSRESQITESSYDDDDERNC